MWLRMVVRKLAPRFVRVRLMSTFGEMRFQLGNILKRRTSWKNDRASLPRDLGLLSDLLGALETFLRLSIGRLRKNEARSIGCTVLRIMKRTNRIVSCSFIHVTARIRVVLNLRRIVDVWCEKLLLGRPICLLFHVGVFIAPLARHLIGFGTKLWMIL